MLRCCRTVCRHNLFILFVVVVAACNDGGNDEPAVTIPTQIAMVQELEIGRAVQGEISAEQPVETWVVSVEPGSRAFIQLTRLDGDVHLDLQLIDPAGRAVHQMQTEDTATSVPLLLPQTGDYSLTVRGLSGTGTFNVILADGQVEPTATPEESPTASLTATFTPSPSFTATVATVEVVPSTLPAPAATATPVPPTTVPAEAAALPADAAPVPAEAAAVPEAPGGRLEVGASRLAEITQEGETHRYTFVGNAEESIAILANPDPNAEIALNPYLELQAPSGEIVIENDNWQDNITDALIRYEIPITGVYTIYVSSADGVSTGRYIISTSQGFTIRDVERGLALHNQANEQTLETYGARDVWTVELDEGELVSIAVEVVDRESDFDVMTELVAPNGETWFADGGGANNDAFLDSITAPVGGTYLIHIAARNNASIGAYRLWWQRLNDFPTATPITPSVTPTQTASIAPTQTTTPSPSLSPTPPTPGAPIDTIQTGIGQGRVYQHVVEMESGQTINVAVIGGEAFDPVLRLVDPAGNIVVEVDDVGASLDPRTSFTATVSGLYTIEVQGYEGGSGNFTLNYIIQ